MPAERGFTLLEVLVAFIIAALALSLMFRGGAAGLAATGAAQRYQDALSRAQSHLATLGHGVALAPASQQGDDGSGFTWSLRIVPLANAAASRQPADAVHGAAARLTLYEAEVVESWAAPQGRRDIRLTTQRVAP
jgi:general secretion pathway protein I